MAEATLRQKIQGALDVLGEQSFMEPLLCAVRDQKGAFDVEALALAYAKAEALPEQVRRNLRRGFRPPQTSFGFSGSEKSGNMERAVLWACLCPGDGKRAKELAQKDAVIDRRGTAVEEVGLWAALLALAFTKEKEEALRAAMELLREESPIVKMGMDALLLWKSGAVDLRERMNFRWGRERYACCSRALCDLLLGGDSMPARAFEAMRCGSFTESETSKRIVQLGLRLKLSADRQNDSGMFVTLLGRPTLSPGKARACMLHIENNGLSPLSGEIEWEGNGSMTVAAPAAAEIPAGEKRVFPITVWLPEETEYISEDNVITLRFSGTECRFGLHGAQCWRISGAGIENEFYDAESDLLELDEICGAPGPCVLVLERRIRIETETAAELRLRHNRAVTLELDGKMLASEQGSDGWAMMETRIPIRLPEGEHCLKVTAERGAPGGKIEMNWLCGGDILPLISRNLRREA